MPVTDLRKWYTSVFTNKTISDPAQIPAFADVTVYRRGATATAGSTVTVAGVVVNVHDIGRIVVGDAVGVNTVAAAMTCTAIYSSKQMVLTAIGPDVVVTTGDRLVPTNNKPTLYDNSSGHTPALPNPSSTDSSGFIKLYLTEPVFDYKVSGLGISDTLFTDEESGQRTRQLTYNVMDYAADAPQGGAAVDVQLALNSVPRGRKLYFPADEGPFVPPSAAGWDVLDAIEIYSDGDSVPEDKCFQYYGSSFAGGTAQNSVIFNLRGDGVAGQSLYFGLRDAVISGTGSFNGTNGTGDAIRCISNPYGFYGPVNIENVRILYAGRSGIWQANSTTAIDIVSDPANPICVDWTLNNVIIQQCGGHGIVMTGMHYLTATGLTSARNFGMGILIAAGDGSNFTGLNLEGNGSLLASTSNVTRPMSGHLLTGSTYDGAKYNGQMYIYGSDISIRSCNIESWLDNANCFNGIVLDYARGCSFQSIEIGYGAVPKLVGSRAFALWNNSSGNTIHMGIIALVDIIVETDLASHSNIVFPYNVFEGHATGGQSRIVFPAGHRNMAFIVNRPGGVATLTSTLVGIAWPQLGSAAGVPTTDVDASVRISGLQVYNSNDKKMYVYDGANFIPQT